jgi:hypothetical protein
MLRCWLQVQTVPGTVVARQRLIMQKGISCRFCAVPCLTEQGICWDLQGAAMRNAVWALLLTSHNDGAFSNLFVQPAPCAQPCKAQWQSKGGSTAGGAPRTTRHMPSSSSAVTAVSLPARRIVLTASA